MVIQRYDVQGADDVFLVCVKVQGSVQCEASEVRELMLSQRRLSQCGQDGPRDATTLVSAFDRSFRAMKTSNG
jgi:hypothetical protein